MIQSVVLRNGLKYIIGVNMRKRGSFSYQLKDGNPDLQEQIRELRSLEDSPYSGRSEADIAGMILLQQVAKELKKYKHESEESGR